MMKRSELIYQAFDSADEAHRINYSAPLASGILAAAFIGMIAVVF